MNGADTPDDGRARPRGADAGAGAVVFLGPTLPAARARALLPGATILPPARQGDLYRAVRDLRPAAVGLVDGLFLNGAAVWHREILWALAEGVRVLGAASMGALRCAETHIFGMEPIGKIAAAYIAGHYPPYEERFEDDDEVAVVHAPAGLGWLPASDAMVDLRETLAAAEAAGVVGRAARDALCAAQKRLHFPDRGLARLVETAPALAGAEGEAFAAWTRRAGNAVSQKRRDAEALMARLAADAASAPVRPAFHFERTAIWERFRARADAADALLGGPS